MKSRASSISVFVLAGALLAFGAAMTPLGAVPVALGLAVAFVAHLGALAFRDDDVTTQWLGGATFFFALASGGTRLAALVGAAKPAVLLAALAVSTLAIVVIARRRGVVPALRLPLLLDASSAGFVVVLAASTVIVVTAAVLLPIWQYDALSYHLPFVNLVLQEGSSSAVPFELSYLGTYPHAVEWIFVAMRATLPDDRLFDLAQAPFAAVGALVVFAFARRLGGRSPLAFGAAVAWIAMPAVLLQIPTNYIDVAAASAYLLAAFFLTRPKIDAAGLLAAGAAMGLFLGSKPSAPLGTALLGVVLVLRARQGSRWGAAAVACTCVLLLGGESYVHGLVEHGNPVWPVEVQLGPLHLPGSQSLDAVLSSGPGAERAHGTLPARIAQSWTRLYATPSFDMRVGGLGPLGLVALAVGAYGLVRRRAVLLGVLWLGAALSPDPAVCRYVLAFPAIALAVAAAELDRARPQVRVFAGWASAAFACGSLVHAAPGLQGEGPSLAAYAAMTWSEREVAVGADGRPDGFVTMRNRLSDGEAVAFDATVDLPYLLWRPDLGTRAVYLSDAGTPDEHLARIDRERVRFLVVADDGELARSMEPRLAFLFRCKSAPCSAYEVR
jgi:hypothetical protein